MKRLTINCATGEIEEFDLSPAEIETDQKRRDEEKAKDEATRAKHDAVLARVLSDSKLRDIAILLGWAE